MRNTCGSTDTASGEPCGRAAGWGTESDLGECRDHAEEYTLPDKLTDKRREQILGAIEAGATLKHAAGYADIDESTLHRWLAKGKRHAGDDIDSPLAELFASVQRARGRGAVVRLSNASDEFVLKASYGYTPREAIQFELPEDAEDRRDTLDQLEAIFTE